MKILTIGRDLQIINQLIEQEGMTLVEKNPDVIITHGGDGILLEAERNYPGIKKLPIRYNSICKTCIDHDTTHAIKALARNTISTSILPKLETTVDGKKLLALNEISLHHAKPTQAIRFKVQIDDEDHVKEAIGDGLVIATPFGSHAYYRSITNSTFRLGLGLAFNNTTEPIDHIVIHSDDPVKLTIIRGPAYLVADNNPEMFVLEKGQMVEVRQSRQTASLLGMDHFRCPDCGDEMKIAAAESRL